MTTPRVRWLALGLTFALLAEGGRRTDLDLCRSPSYRPNWGLPWMLGTGQTAAWVLCGAPSRFAPGDQGRIVIAPQIDLAVEQWRHVHPGDRVRAFEGAKVVGSGQVRRIRAIGTSSPEGAALELLQQWVVGGPEPVPTLGPV